VEFGNGSNGGQNELCGRGRGGYLDASNGIRSWMGLTGSRQTSQREILPSSVMAGLMIADRGDAVKGFVSYGERNRMFFASGSTNHPSMHQPGGGSIHARPAGRSAQPPVFFSLERASGLSRFSSPSAPWGPCCDSSGRRPILHGKPFHLPDLPVSAAIAAAPALLVTTHRRSRYRTGIKGHGCPVLVPAGRRGFATEKGPRKAGTQTQRTQR